MLGYDSEDDEIGARIWEHLLGIGPKQDADPDVPWERIDGRGWVFLLKWQPQFFTECAWDKLSIWDWGTLIMQRPWMVSMCPVDILPNVYLPGALREHPDCEELQDALLLQALLN